LYEKSRNLLLQEETLQIDYFDIEISICEIIRNKELDKISIIDTK